MADWWQKSQWVAEAWGGTILLLPWGLLILRWRLWTHYYHKVLCRMGQIERAPARPHLLIISHNLQRKSLQFLCQKCHTPWRWNLDPNVIWFASPATQWPSYVSPDVRCHHQGPSQLATFLGEDAAWRSGKVTLHPLTQMAEPCRT